MFVPGHSANPFTPREYDLINSAADGRSVEASRHCKPVSSVDARLSARQGGGSPCGIRSGCY